MNWRVILRPKAEADLHEAWLWYESQRSGLGDELLLEIGSAVRQLETDPERRPFYYRDFRRLLTHRFPYKLLFKSLCFGSCTRNDNMGGTFDPSADMLSGFLHLELF